MNIHFSSFGLTLLLLLACSLTMAAQDQTSALVPMPNKIEAGSGNPFTVTQGVTFTCKLSRNSHCREVLQNIFKERFDEDITWKNNSTSTVDLTIDLTIEGKEHYIIDVTEQKLSIRGGSEAALFYGLMTLDQLLMGDVCHTSNRQIAPIHIDDTPRYGYRALMLDPARHFIPVEDVKFFIDQMARFKFNTLQLHLTDDQGWRIEIKKYPRLTEIGAFRDPKGGSNGPDNGFYTQKQIRELVQYASDRHVQIIPELDIPGHVGALLAAYPMLCCTSGDTARKVVGESSNLTVCANNPKFYGLFNDIFREIASMFPAEEIHLGGDEANIDKNWGSCDRCKALMKEKELTQPSQLMGVFFEKIFDILQNYEKKPMLWCELNSIYPPATDFLFKYPQNVTLITWRNGLTPACISLTHKNGNPLIMAPGEYAYLDYPQLKGDLPEFNNWGMPVTTLETCYKFDPGYGLPDDQQSHIRGICGTLWGEAMKDINRVTYMTFPRGMALAEAGWSQLDVRGWESFKRRMYPNLMNLMRHGVSVRAPFEIVPR